MTAPRPTAMIRHDLELASAYRERYQQRSSSNPLVLRMREANERELSELNAELVQATSGDLEITLLGSPYVEHRVSIPYFTRVLEGLQSTFRATCRAIAPDGRLRRSDATLSLVGMAPGSFKVMVMTPPAQLDLLDSPIVDRALNAIVDVLASAERGTASEDIPPWVAQSDEPVVRSMIRLSVALAGSQGTVSVRWRGISSNERIVAITSDAARDLAIALSGEAGREILIVTGHLEMGQDQPPRVRIRTADDEYLANVTSEDLLDRVKDLLFGEVQATLVVDMRTSPTTGNPGTQIELLDLQAL